MKTPVNSNHFRPTRAVVYLDALKHNLKLAQDLAGPGISLMGVVKANAYGHGAVPVAQAMESGGIQAMGVATPREGVQLRQGGVRAPLYVFGGPFAAPGDHLVEHDLVPVLYNENQVDHLSGSLTWELEVVLKVDTGMTRLGILPEQLPAMLKKIQNAKRLRLSGVMTHLAQADTTFEGPTAKQYAIFTDVERQVRELAPEVKIFHMANSAALLGKKLGPCNWARPGIMLYGASPHPRFEVGKKLKPVMKFLTQVVSLKEIPAGVSVSYGGTWTAPRPSRIAVLPVGYADGYIRHLSDVGEVLTLGRRAPVVGRVCMDLTMIDVTEIPEVGLGTEVTLWGPGLPAEELAERAGTISYELFCGISPRVPLIYEGENR